MDNNKLGRKFKVGDKVRVVTKLWNTATSNLCVGDITEVVCYKSDNVKHAGLDDNRRSVVVREPVGGSGYDYFEESALELVEETVQPTSTPTVYLAAPISTDGDIMYVNHLASELRNIGYNVYSPIEDESINDKSRNPQSTDIYGNDTSGIDNADIVLVVESGREQVGTHVELGKVLKAIENGSNVKLIAFTNNKRLQSPQIEDGLPSASMNAFAYGGIKQHGTWVSGGTDGLLTYMRELIGAGVVETATDEEKLVTKGDNLVDSDDYTICTVIRLDDVCNTDFPYFVLSDIHRRWVGDDVLVSDYAKLLEDGRVYEGASDLTFANIDAYKRYKEAE